MEVLHALFLPKSEIPKPKPGTMKTLNLNPKPPKKKPCHDLQEDLSNINSPRLVQKTLRFYRGCLRFQRGFDKNLYEALHQSDCQYSKYRFSTS